MEQFTGPSVAERIHRANLQGLRRCLRSGKRVDDITDQELITLIEQQGYRCALCPRRIIHTFHLDHKVPDAIGGLHIRGNLQFLCPPCNLSKNRHLTPLISVFNESNDHEHECAEYVYAETPRDPNRARHW